MNVTLMEEYLKLVEVFDWEIEHFYNCQNHANPEKEDDWFGQLKDQ